MMWLSVPGWCGHKVAESGHFTRTNCVAKFTFKQGYLLEHVIKYFNCVHNWLGLDMCLIDLDMWDKCCVMYSL